MKKPPTPSKTTQQDNPLNHDDMALFRQAVGDVKAIKHTQTANTGAPKPKPIPRQAQLDDEQVKQDMLSDHFDHIETGEELSYHQDGIQKTVLRKLKRGHFAIEDELDLHGHRKDEARAEVYNFLKHAKAHRKKCVRIIHGRALGNANGAVLKPLVNTWLRQTKDVLAFCSARPQDGGAGAVYVLIKSA